MVASHIYAHAIGNLTGVAHTIIIGSATQADQVIRSQGLEITRGFKVHGIVDLKPRKQGHYVRGIPIIGVIDELGEVVTRLSRRGVTLDSAILACPDLDKNSLASLMSFASSAGLRLRRVQPANIGSSEIALRDLTLEDLLGRPPVRLQLEEIRSLITKRVVVITGAGGSIGSEVTLQVASHDPGAHRNGRKFRVRALRSRSDSCARSNSEIIPRPRGCHSVMCASRERCAR